MVRDVMIVLIMNRITDCLSLKYCGGWKRMQNRIYKLLNSGWMQPADRFPAIFALHT